MLSAGSSIKQEFLFDELGSDRTARLGIPRRLNYAQWQSQIQPARQVDWAGSLSTIPAFPPLAEYVHKPVIAEILKEMGVDYAQGFALHEPEPFEAPPA